MAGAWDAVSVTVAGVTGVPPSFQDGETCVKICVAGERGQLGPKRSSRAWVVNRRGHRGSFAVEHRVQRADVMANLRRRGQLQ